MPAKEALARFDLKVCSSSSKSYSLSIALFTADSTVPGFGALVVMAAPSAPSLALLVCRWGGWPGWTPLLLRGFEANPSVNFFLVSDSSPSPLPMPANVKLLNVTLEALLIRLRTTVGCKLKSLRASGTFASGPSSAKTNGEYLKRML